MQYLRARLNAEPLPRVQATAPSPSPAPDAAHAGEVQPQPDPTQAAALLDAALEGSAASLKPGGMAKPQPLWLVDCGNFAAIDVTFPGLRARTHLEALKLMGCVAAVPGAMELQLTPEQAREFISTSAVPIVSCNLELKLDGAGVKPYVMLAPGWYLTGVSCWTPAIGDPPAKRWWDLANPADSVRTVQAKLPKGARLIVIATYQPDTVVAELAKLAAVVVANAQAAAPQGAVILPPAASRAQYLALATVEAQGQTVTGTPWQVMLSDVWPDDAQVVALFKEEYKRVRERILGIRAGTGGKNGWKKIDWNQSEKFLPSKSGAREGGGIPGGGVGAEGTTAPASSGPQFTGAASCKPCHAAAYAVWEKSLHAAAMSSLRTPEDQGNLDCLKCHSTGLLQPGGYDPFAETAALGTVGCEMCHGPGSQHVALMSSGRAGANAGGGAGAASGGGLSIRRGSLSKCVSCHDKYNSPKFEAQAYWAKVKH